MKNLLSFWVLGLLEDIIEILLLFLWGSPLEGLREVGKRKKSCYSLVAADIVILHLGKKWKKECRVFGNGVNLI